MKENISLNSKNWNIKEEERSRGRMKLIVKLSKAETESFTNWRNMVIPPDMPQETFYRSIFFAGVKAMNKTLDDIAKESVNNPEIRKKLEEMGVKVERIENEEVVEVKEEDKKE